MVRWVRWAGWADSVRGLGTRLNFFVFVLDLLLFLTNPVVDAVVIWGSGK